MAVVYCIKAYITKPSQQQEIRRFGVCYHLNKLN